MDKSALFKLSYGLYVLGVANGEGFGGCVVDALMQATSGDEVQVALCCMNGNLTTELIKKSGLFTVSVLSAQADPFVIANFGFQSCRDAEKWVNVPHRLFGGLPVLENAGAYLLCRVDEVKPMSTHCMFICSVIDAENGSGEPMLYGDYHKKLKAPAAAAFAAFRQTGKAPSVSSAEASVPDSSDGEKKEKWVCSICGYEYDGEVAFEDLPEDWTCPLCGQPKSVFEKQ